MNKKTTEKNRINDILTYPILSKSDRRGSNPRPRPWQGRTLPTEPLSLILFCVPQDNTYITTWFRICQQVFQIFFIFFGGDFSVPHFYDKADISRLSSCWECSIVFLGRDVHSLALYRVICVPSVCKSNIFLKWNICRPTCTFLL